MRNPDRFTGFVSWDDARFLEDFRASFGTDAESELVEPCKNGCGYPAALHGECFSCLARGTRRLPS
jgi:hypothetical protein